MSYENLSYKAKETKKLKIQRIVFEGYVCNSYITIVLHGTKKRKRSVHGQTYHSFLKGKIIDWGFSVVMFSWARALLHRRPNIRLSLQI